MFKFKQFLLDTYITLTDGKFSIIDTILFFIYLIMIFPVINATNLNTFKLIIITLIFIGIKILKTFLQDKIDDYIDKIFTDNNSGEIGKMANTAFQNAINNSIKSTISICYQAIDEIENEYIQTLSEDDMENNMDVQNFIGGIEYAKEIIKEMQVKVIEQIDLNDSNNNNNTESED